MSIFYVTAVRYSSDHSHISHVLVHSPENVGGRLTKGIILSKEQVITNIGQGHIYTTAIHSYRDQCWKYGAKIGIVSVGFNRYLRTDRDSTSTDNLENLLLIDELR
ncbi:DUF3892 domain-containing protein [Chryseobacterium paludis]|uniref:DUF3892 domain-containing protein n=1 Tax=Chryseobacterium paludis TaxID=2956784 RepID=UPI0036F2BEC9